MAEPRISVVIPTFERPDACAAAVASALEQTLAPLEVLVCDDGSADETRDRFSDWEGRDPRVRYVRIEPNRGTPGPARSRGVSEARGDWIAFLDDDDEFLPTKLERQAERAARGDADVIGTNALLRDGSLYFRDAGSEWRPARHDLLRDNPLVISTVMARRETIEAAGPFREERWARGVADYEMWLRLADGGARFVVLPEPLVRYDDSGAERMSARPVYQETAVARMAWLRWRQRPADRTALRAALGKTLAAVRVWHERRAVRD